jgi:4-hydroxy-2-oxovalerate aldolase
MQPTQVSGPNINRFERQPEIMEVTLRDGSYVVDFQFTAHDTATMASVLEKLGFRWIEAGHGLGLNGSASGAGQAAATDEQYLEAMAGSVKAARWGMFYIPGVGRPEDLQRAVRYGMSFVRIGVNVTEAHKAESLIDLAKGLGLTVCCNPMKSYAVSAAEFGRVAGDAARWGADVVYLVDSAGSMYPEDVQAYLAAARNETDVALGFHGHNNLSLAMANSLRAIECGAALIDSSLQGLGRSAGNAATEVLVAILKQRGLWPDADLKSILDAGRVLVQPLLRKRGIDPLAVTAGYAHFHSSFDAKVRSYARKYGVDVHDLVVRLCEEDQVNAPDALLDQLSHELAAERLPRVISLPMVRGVDLKSDSSEEVLSAVLKELRTRGIKSGRFSVLNVVRSEQDQLTIAVSRNIQSTLAYLIGSTTYSDTAQLSAVLTTTDGIVDVVLLDVDERSSNPVSPARTAQLLLKKSLMLPYSDSLVRSEALANQINSLLGGVLTDTALVLVGNHPRMKSLAERFVEQGASVTWIVSEHDAPSSPVARGDSRSGSSESTRLRPSIVLGNSAPASEALRKARLVLIWPHEGAQFNVGDAECLSAGAWVMDGGIGTIEAAALEKIRQIGARPVRINIWPALAGALATAHEAALVCSEALGWDCWDGVPVVAGGALGQKNDVVVDSIHKPTRVIGLADGRGGVRFDYDAEGTARVRRVQEAINQRLLHGEE